MESERSHRGPGAMSRLEALRAWGRSRLLPALGRPEAARLADLGALGAIAAVYALFSRAFVFSDIGFDEKYFLSVGFAVGLGLVPYSDFKDFKPALVFVLNMLAPRCSASTACGSGTSSCCSRRARSPWSP